jgi:hypothetical protein
MTCLGQTGQLDAQVHRPIRLDFEVLVEVERMMLLSTILVESWCLSEPSACVELW